MRRAIQGAETIYQNITGCFINSCAFLADHFNKNTIRALAEKRPALRFCCPEYLVRELSQLVNYANIDMIDIFNHGEINYGLFMVEASPLVHDVPNCAYYILFKDLTTVFYATDTGDISHIKAPDCDYYFIEANHDEDEILQRIKQKQESGEYCYEIEAAKNHLSRQQSERFLTENAGVNSKFVFMHGTRKGIENG